jgi:hypothetical protein
VVHGPAWTTPNGTPGPTLPRNLLRSSGPRTIEDHPEESRNPGSHSGPGITLPTGPLNKSKRVTFSLDSPLGGAIQ